MTREILIGIWLGREPEGELQEVKQEVAAAEALKVHFTGNNRCNAFRISMLLPNGRGRSSSKHQEKKEEDLMSMYGMKDATTHRLE
ncbi:hypothetical protein OH77DRAFT_1421081 [Trametes cingulata]|nr:hypothetical protein OH77DRAFT_1421081 [Trametes cingulata]